MAVGTLPPELFAQQQQLNRQQQMAQMLMQQGMHSNRKDKWSAVSM
jgi:hypothetical protein